MTPEDLADDEGWSARHDGVRPSPVVRGWLRMVRALAAGPLLRVPPDVLSATGVLALAGALAAVAASHPMCCRRPGCSRWPARWRPSRAPAGL
ncbi:hypothetical protein H7I41_22265, partial [Mycobacterium manitobense]